MPGEFDKGYILVGTGIPPTRMYQFDTMEQNDACPIPIRDLSPSGILARFVRAIDSRISGLCARDKPFRLVFVILYNRHRTMSIDEKEVITRATKGDGEAFAHLYERYFDKIYRYICLRVGNQAEVEDLTQEVFVKALEAIGSYRWRSLPFGSWLFRIAHNHTIDHLRRASKIETTAWDDDAVRVEQPNPATIAEQRLEIEELRDKIEKLPPAQRAVISLRFGGELSVAEVAKVLGKSPGTVKALQHSGIMALKKMLSVDKENET